MLVLRIKNFAKGRPVQFLSWYCPVTNDLHAFMVIHTNVKISTGRSINYSLFIAPGSRKDKVV